MRERKVFLVDDDDLIVTVLVSSLKSGGYAVRAESGTEKIIDKIKAWAPDVVLLDINLPGRSGIDILKEIRERGIDTEAIMLTADDTAETAIQAMKLGAADYLTKPFDTDEVLLVIDRTIKNKKLKHEVDYYRKLYLPIFDQDLIGGSPAMIALKEKIDKLAQARVATILITGPSGTGKEVAARCIHRRMHGENTADYAPFVAVNCAALPENILESELFGYEKGAFTDAKSDKKGLFEVAAGGTILLDEIGEMKLSLQAKLLRVLEERTVRRVGGKQDIPFEATVTATTNRDLAEAVSRGEFRLDLFHRLSVFSLSMAPLKERKEDIPGLANHFLSRLSKKYNNQHVKEFSPEAIRVLQAHEWSGNVRELRNVIERVVVLEQTATVTPEQLSLGPGGQHPANGHNGAANGRYILPEKGISLEELEKDLIAQAMARAKNNKAMAAKLLGLSYNAMRWQVKKIGLE